MIEIRDRVRSSKPCFARTRITVYDVLDYIASGTTTEQVTTDSPELRDEHVRAALLFAAMQERRLATPA